MRYKYPRPLPHGVLCLSIFRPASAFGLSNIMSRTSEVCLSRQGITDFLKQAKLIRPPPNSDLLQVRPGSTTYLYAVTVFVSLGAFLFGYDQGVMGVIVADQRWIDLMHPKNSCKYEQPGRKSRRANINQGSLVPWSRCMMSAAFLGLCLLDIWQTLSAVRERCPSRVLYLLLGPCYRLHHIPSRKL
jgi:hypothetical protein